MATGWQATTGTAERVGRHIDASPTPYHAVAHAAGLLEAAGGRAAATARQAASPGLWFHASGGSLSAWHVAPHHGARSGFRLIGAHTDSPNLRLKPRPDQRRAGCLQLGVEVYGSALLNSWLDRDLGVAGRLALRASDGRGVRSRLVRIDEPLLRVPQLAVHLDRGVNVKGLVLNPQQHLTPIWGVDCGDGNGSGDDDGSGDGFVATVAAAAGVEPSEVIGHELMAFDLTPARLTGQHAAMLAAARIDNLVSCFTAVEALADLATDPQRAAPRIPMVCLFDHEEVGSVSASGAASPLLERQLAQIAAGFDASADDLAASRADTVMLSADGAHATHPNYPDRHDPQHPVRLNGGPVLKTNASQRYATDAVTGATFRLACERAGVPVQHFVSRSDMGCGSTIGPITAARLGVGVVDAGCPQLAMHSAREVCGSHDVAWFAAALLEFLAG